MTYCRCKQCEAGRGRAGQPRRYGTGRKLTRRIERALTEWRNATPTERKNWGKYR